MTLYNEMVRIINDAYEKGKLDAELGASTDLSLFYSHACSVARAELGWPATADKERLIAAAPTLLKACEAALSYLGAEADHIGLTEYEEVITRLIAAIAAATPANASATGCAAKWKAIAQAEVKQHGAIAVEEVRQLNEPAKAAIIAAVDAERAR